MFLQIFSVLCALIILIHLFVFFLFPKIYLSARKVEIENKADQISKNLNGKDRTDLEKTLDFYSKTSEIKAFVREKTSSNEIPIEKEIQIDPQSKHNSLLIEERKVFLNTGDPVFVQFISTADMQKEAKALTLGILPYSLSFSLLFSVMVSLIYARSIRDQIQEIQEVTDKMMALDQTARLKVDAQNEVGQLKEQINDLYSTLLQAMEDLEKKNQEVLRLEQLKYDFFRGSSHELKTPLASLKIILENMKYRIGKYKDRDQYIGQCIDIVDELSRNIAQMLTVSSLDHLKQNEELLVISDPLDELLKKYGILASQKKIRIQNDLADEKIRIGKSALKMILSNLLSNAVKYTDEKGLIHIGTDQGWFFIENTDAKRDDLPMKERFQEKFDSNQENSSGLGLYIVSQLLDHDQIPYQLEQKEGTFVFKMKIQDPLDEGEKEQRCTS